MMPKGVEHVGVIYYKNRGFIVPTSLMPKGVEHFWLDCYEFFVSSANLIDAERR